MRHVACVFRIVALAVVSGLGLVRWAPAQESEGLRLEDVLNPAQIAHVARRRAQIDVPPGSSYRFTFQDGPRYKQVEVYYLIEMVQEDGRTVRRLAKVPSAVVYLLYADQPAEIRKHVNEKDFAKVIRQLMDARNLGRRDPMVRIQRLLFDIGGTPPADFLRDREKYYDGTHNQPAFDSWPADFRTPSGRFTASVVQTSIVGDGAAASGMKIIQARQFFGYVFPVLDQLLSGEQKKRLSDDLARVNVREGEAVVTLNDVQGLGEVMLHYLVKDGKPLPRPTAMASSVRLSAKQIAEDPMVLRKYLAPEGVEHLAGRIRDGEQAGRRVRAVEIIRMHFDVVSKDEAGAEAARLAFKKSVSNYCRRDQLIGTDKWPDEFRRPDGKFDLEFTSARIVWLVTEQE